MKLIYPALFHAEDGAYWVEFPDLDGCQTYGDTIDETLFNAQEALEVYAITLLEQGKQLPPPSDITEIKTEESTFTSLIYGDVSGYLKKDKAVKKTLTIPSWLNDLAMDKGVNFSQALQDALMEKLVITKK